MNLKKSFINYCKDNNYEINQNQIVLVEKLTGYYYDNFNKIVSYVRYYDADGNIDCNDEEDCWYAPECSLGTCPDYDLIDPSTFLPSQGVALVDIGLEVAGDDEISSCIDDGGSEYSYYWEAPSSGCVQVMAMSDTMDLGLYAFDDCNGTELSCNDDSSFASSFFGTTYPSILYLVN